MRESEKKAAVDGVDGGYLVGVALYEVGKAVEELASFGGGSLLPCRLKGLFGGGDGLVDVLALGGRDGG